MYIKLHLNKTRGGSKKRERDVVKILYKDLNQFLKNRKQPKCSLGDKQLKCMCVSIQVGSSLAEPQGKPIYTMGYYAAIKILFSKNKSCENSLAIQWLGLCTFTAKPPGLIPGQGTKIPQAAQHGQKRKNKWCKNAHKMQA